MMSILIVDDTPELQLILRRILEHSGYAELLCADSGEEALRLLRESVEEDRAPVGLVLMDIVMGGMNGVEACRQIKADPRLRDIPVLMVTAQPEAAELREAFAAGAADYVRKPVEREILLARVRHALRLKEEIDRRKARELELVAAQRQLEEVNAALQRLATQDGLTGIPNRRRLDDHLDQEWRRCQREGWPLAALVADVDHFKSFNDAFGHLAGDQCLRRVAAAIERSLARPGDLAARYGGEEFAVVLPKTDLEGALKVAEEVRAAVLALRIPHGVSGAAEHVTVSIGAAACLPCASLSAEQLLREADAALYHAKAAGRNCVRVAVPAHNY